MNIVKYNFLKGFILRLVLTLIIFSVLPNFKLNKYYYIILPILLIILDLIDGIFVVILKEYQKEKNKNNLFDNFYHLNDKIIDSLSYLFVWYIFKLDYKYLFLILYRFIGVYYFYYTNNKKIFTLFPDLFKEYLIVDGLFNSNNYIVYIIVLFIKMIFEYLFHGN